MISVELNKQQRALFSHRMGFLQKIILNSDATAHDRSSSLKTKMKLIKYGVTNAREKSGAYLFLPDGPAIDVDSSLFRYSNGLDPKVEHVDTEAVQLRTHVLHEYDHHIALCGVLPDVGQEEKRPLINVWNVVDLRQSQNYELAMHLETSILNKVS